MDDSQGSGVCDDISVMSWVSGDLSDDISDDMSVCCMQSLDGMTVHGRLDEIRKRYRISKYSDNIRLRYGYTKLTQAEKRLWDSGDWTQADQLKVESNSKLRSKIKPWQKEELQVSKFIWYKYSVTPGSMSL